MKNLPILKNWDVQYLDNGNPKQKRYYMTGTIYNDIKHRFKDGTSVYTSYLKSIDFEKGLAQTRNTLYKLEVE
jgi:hypothetical protein